MNRFCFTSVCTDDSYQFFVPLFVYSIRKSYPDAGIRVFVKGVLKAETRKALAWIEPGDWIVKEGCFRKYPDLPAMTNSLRFLVGKHEFRGFDYVFVRDIDFLIFKHKISHVDYFSKCMRKHVYFGVRGPYRHPYRPAVNFKGWRGDFARMAGGTFVFKNPEWYTAAEKIQKKYRYNLRRGISDPGDYNIPASYREYDEVMLYRIVKKAGLKVPRRKGKSVSGKSMPKMYRDLHLGDFSKSRHKYGRLCRRLAVGCLRKFVELERDEVWRKVSRSMSSANPKIREILRRVRKHAKRRLSSSCLSGGEIVKKA